MTFTHPEIVAKVILSHPIVVGQFNNKVLIFRTKANHRFTPSSVVRTAWIENVNKHVAGLSLRYKYSKDQVQLLITHIPIARRFTAFLKFFMA